MAVATSLAAVGLTGVFASWSFLARMAVTPEAPASLQLALEAMDERRFEDAKAMVGRLQRRELSQETIGGLLFVLGAAKANEAEEEWSAERRRAMHLVAARYLQKARALGVPDQRSPQLLFLLGKSLVEANQPQPGIAALEEALEDPEPPAGEIHALLVGAHMQTADPNLGSALAHAEYVLKTGSLPDGELQKARAVRVEILLRMGRTQEARRAIDGLADENADAAGVELMLGRLDVQEALSLADDAPERREKINAAKSRFATAQRLDPLGGAHGRQAAYWLAKTYEHLGDVDEALAMYNRAARQFGETPEGLAAALAEADLELDALRFEKAIAGYRRVLEAVRNPAALVNPLLPASLFRKRMLAAHQRFVANQDFEDALTLVELLESAFSHLDCVQLRAKTHAAWGRSLAEAALREDPWSASAVKRQSRYHFRAAGRSFEDLARLRYSSRLFTDDLMDAAESYFTGQGYSSAARVLREFLHHEARRRNARALLLLGRSLLARNEPEEAIQALTECAEMYPRDAAVYQARLERARAHRQLGQFEDAERQLLKNLVGDTLTPDSLEWRDSLFALGRLLFDAGRYDAAISRLEEAVARYPDAEEFLLAKYTIARSHHNAAAEPARRLREAKTENERQKNRTQMEHYLTRAHDTYVDVQRQLALEGMSEGNVLHHTLLRNCYMMQGSVLFELRKFEKARQAFANVVTYYQHEPFVLEAFVQIANCSRRLDDPVKAKANIAQAMLKLKELPTDADYRVSTNFTRQQWEMLLAQMFQW